MTETNGRRPAGNGSASSKSEGLRVALYLAKQGYHVFPATVRYGADGVKQVQPHVAWRMASCALPGMIREWWKQHPAAWPCIDTGKSGIVVVDCDVKDGDGPGTFRALAGFEATEHVLSTTSGGVHFIYAAEVDAPCQDTEAVLGLGIDTRAVGGMIIVHPAGYAQAMSLPPVAELDAVPSFVVDATASGKPQEARTAVEPAPASPEDPEDDFDAPGRVFTPSQARAFIRREAREPLLQARRGTINRELNRAACVLSHFIPDFYSRADAERWLLDWQRRAWIASGGSDDGDYTAARRTIASGLRQTRDPWRAVAAPEIDTPATPAAPATPAVEVEADPESLLLPESFWSARPVLEQIRAVAHARMVSADVVLHSTFARLVSVLHHGVKVESSMGAACLNLFTIPIGPSGAGKTLSFGLAEELIPTPRCLDAESYMDGVPLGSGEGLAEMFMGITEVQVDNGNGGTKTQKVRQQVRHNALIYVDEGDSLVKVGQRSGSTTLATLRTAWVGHTLGQMNGRTETTRIVEKGTYALGAILGFQLSTVGPILDDSGSGTAQRMLFCWALDPNIPEDAPEDTDPRLANIEHVIEWGHNGHLTTMRIPVEADRELRRAKLAVNRGEKNADAEIDRHRPLHMMKISALLALLDHRKDITVEDWELARVVWNTSCRVREHCYAWVIEDRRRQSAGEAEKQIDIRATAVVRATEQLETRQEGIARVLAEQLAKRVHQGGPVGLGRLRNGLRSNQRQHFDDALALAVEREWLRVDERGSARGKALVCPGDAAPLSTKGA